jgi:mannuronan synthase
LIDGAGAGLIQIDLPLGELDLEQPIEIHRSRVRLVGQGADRTILMARGAAVVVKPKDVSSVLEDVHLQGFTVRGQVSQTAESIVLEQVCRSSLRHIHLVQGSDRGVVLQGSQDVVMEYVTTEDQAVSARS